MVTKTKALDHNKQANNLLARQSSQPHIIGKEYAKQYKPRPARAAKSVSRLVGKRAESKLSSPSGVDHGIKAAVDWDSSMGPTRSS